MPAVLVGADTGGTFTDLVAVVGRRLVVTKVRSTPSQPATAVQRGITTLLADRPSVRLHYGSTVATNALLERRGARVALLTTAGFEDVLEIGRQDRPVLYALEPRRRPPLVPRTLRIGIAERTLHDGRIELALTDAELRRIVRRVRRLDVDAVAICLLHAYANPRHERALVRALRTTPPRTAHARALHVTPSHALLREYREYERVATTAVNAYVGPPMAKHLDALARSLAGTLHVMQSNGGLVTAPTAGREAVRTVLSGPAGGIVAATEIARRTGFDRLITFDMGGTSTDVSVIDGRPTVRADTTIDELPIRVPTLDIHTVGAGGGSLARLDAGGALRVGPESAGASPGPACYGQGTQPTVTDAHLVLGRLVETEFLGGTFALDPGRAERALAPLSRALRRPLAAIAAGIVAVATATMERAVRVITVERGLDPRDLALFSFGGAGGLHAVDLATALGISRVLVPPHPGLLSAWGMLAAAPTRDFSQTLRRLSPALAELGTRFRALDHTARRAMRSEGIARHTMHRALDVRYVGQSYELTVPFGRDWRAAFDAEHARRYGAAHPTRPVEVVTLRVQARGLRTAPPLPPVHRGAAGRAIDQRPVSFGGRRVRTAVYRRDTLAVAQRLAGPAIVCEYSATTVVPPGWRARVHESGTLILEGRRG